MPNDKISTVDEYLKKFMTDNPQYSYGAPTDQAAANRAATVAQSGGTLKEVNGMVVPANPPAGAGAPSGTTTTGTGSDIIGGEARRNVSGTLGGKSAADIAAENFYGGLDLNRPNEANIRQQMLDQAQKEIDAIRNTYAGLISTEATREENQTGRTRSINARSGTLGSDFGKAELDKTAAANETAMKALLGERDAKIGAILGNASTRASEEYRNKYNQYISNNEGRLKFLQGQTDQARNELAQLGQEHFTLNDFSDNELRSYMDATGMNEKQISAYLALNRKPADVVQHWAEGNKYYVVTLDPITRKYQTESVDLPFTVPRDANIGAQKLGDNTVVFYDQKTGEILNQMSITPSPTSNLTAEQKNDQYRARLWMRSQPDYTPEFEKAFDSDPVKQAQVIEAWRATTKSSSSSSSSSGTREL